MSKRHLLQFSVILICTIAMLLLLYLLLPFFGYTVKRLHLAAIILLVVLPLWLNHHYHSKHLRKLNHQLSSMDMLMRVNRELARSNLLNKAMLEISNSIVRIQNLDELLQQVLEKAVNIIDSADKGSIMIANREGKLSFRAVYGYDMAGLSRITLSPEETFIYTHTKGASLKACIIQNPQAFNNQNMSQNNLNKFEDAKALDIRATICAPIIVDEELYGLINVDNIFDENAFREEDVRLMEYFANQVGIAIKNVRLFEKTLYLSRYDALTGIYNRHYFEELYANLDKRSKRYGEHFCICIMDLNNLKQINDRFGHNAGDLAIKHFTNIFVENIRESDILARLGGDEFVAVFLNSDFDNTNQRILHIQSKLSGSPIQYDKDSFSVHFSFGIACYPRDASEGKDLIRIADQRMYSNKAHQKTTT